MGLFDKQERLFYILAAMKIQTAVRLDRETIPLMKARAKELNRSVGSYMRNLIAVDLQQSGNADLDAAKEAKKKASKAAVSGINEVSEAAKKVSRNKK
jgi:hypothetical protein